MSTVSRDISLNVIAEVEKYAQGMAKIPGITQKEAAKAATALGKELAKAETIALKNAGQAAQAATKGFGDMRQAVGALSPTVGRLAADFEDLLGFLGPAGAAVGVIAAVGAAGAAFVSLTRSAAESSDELERVGLISQEAGEQLRGATVTIDTASLAWKALAANIAGPVSDALQGLIRWTMIAAMAWDDFIHGRGIADLTEYVSRVLSLEAAVASLGETTARATEEGVGFALNVVAEKADKAEGAFDGLQRATQKSFRIIKEDGHAAALAVQNAWLGGIDNILGAMSGMVEQGSFAAKAIASLQVVVSTAAAFMNALATPPFPLGLALGATALAAGAASLAAVWKAQPGAKSPPSIAAPAPPRGQTSAPRAQASQSAGNVTVSGGGSAVLQFRHRMYDDITDDALRRGNSPLRQAIGGSNPHRSH